MCVCGGGVGSATTLWKWEGGGGSYSPSLCHEALKRQPIILENRS